VAVAALAAALRWYRIDAQSLWYDEGISAHQLTRSFPEILRAAALDTHPPLYYWTLKAWGDALGASELGLRSLSAASGLLGVVLTWLIGRRLFGTLAGTLAVLAAGVAAVAEEAAAAVVLLADMPFTTSDMVARLVDVFRETGAALVASGYEGVQAPPTLYARPLFPELGGSEGDGCGKRVVRKYGSEVVTVPWPADRLADVDREEDWERMCAPTS